MLTYLNNTYLVFDYFFNLVNSGCLIPRSQTLPIGVSLAAGPKLLGRLAYIYLKFLTSCVGYIIGGFASSVLSHMNARSLICPIYVKYSGSIRFG